MDGGQNVKTVKDSAAVEEWLYENSGESGGSYALVFGGGRVHLVRISYWVKGPGLTQTLIVRTLGLGLTIKSAFNKAVQDRRIRN
jgi:hypothetical protein